ncbi:MAG TPA: TonB-dependent receptor [Rubricoccaceae bacterium]
MPLAPRSLLLAALVTAAPWASAQTARPVAPADTARTDTSRDLGRVVVTATRTAEVLEDVPVPTTIVDVRDAETDGRLRLTDLLADVPGLTLTSDFGTGIQVQGLDPAYTLVLIDGEPVVGRTAGVLDLTRLAVSGLDRVEIVRGPSSSLYGSDALAGVINLVTRTPVGPAGRLRARAGTFGTTNLTAEAEAGGQWRGGPVGVRLLLDRYDTDGYDFDPDLFGSTTPTVGETTVDLRATAALSDRTTVDLGARATAGSVDQSRSLRNVLGAVTPADETERRVDWSVHPELRHTFGRVRGAGLAGRLSLYAARFRLDTDIVERATGEATFDDRFDQLLTKAEGHLDAVWGGQHRTLVGAGTTRDALGGNRYEADPSASTVYAFAQHDWAPSRLLALNASARLDAHSAVGARLTPKVALLVRPSERLRARVSVGSGFRAPDSRQLYLTFTNPVGGYLVYGAERVVEGLARLDAEGRLGDVFVDPATLGSVRPESSVALNAEVEVEPVRGFRLTLGGFRNAVTDLIDAQPVAQLVGPDGVTNAGSVFSYVNVDRVRTEGATADVSAAPLGGLTVGVGYQWLRSRDLDVVDKIRAGTEYIRDEDGREFLVTLGDYTNLIGRATHQGTVRTAYSARGWTASVRGRLRSRTGVRDLDGNGFATRADESVPATAIWDATLSRDLALGRGLLARTARLQLGLDNAFDTTHPDLQPSLAGRRVYAALDLTF